MKQKLLVTLLLVVGLLQQVAAQSRAISGRVTDRTNGQGLPGVTVLAKGTTIGVSTNADGGYSITVPTTSSVLTFSSIGYSAVEQPIGSATSINVSLGADTKQLGEVVVTGALGIQRQAQELGYATSTIGSKELNQARVTNVTNGLAGKVSGLQIQTVNNGINPSVRVTLRGTRSLTGENQALVVIDGVQTTQDVLTSLNPDDIADITILKGANAAALYGSQATNGALIITTKKGGNGPAVTFTHTSQLEQISFWPKLQNEFGPGSSEWIQEYTPYENQQYGPRFDGTIRDLGYKPEVGDVQKIAYVSRPNERKDFFNTGYQMQNNVSFSGGDKDTKIYVSYQNTHNKGILPKDEYDRNTFRTNASRQMGKLSAGVNVSYTTYKVDQTTGGVYNQLLNTSSLIPLTQYKNWQTDVYANPNGYYNEYFANPYFNLDDNRRSIRRNTLVGNIDLGYKITSWLTAQYRIGLTAITEGNKSWQEKFTYSNYTLTRPINSRTNIPGAVSDLSSAVNRLNSDLFLNFDKKFGVISVKAILGNNVQVNNANYQSVAANALFVPGVFNVNNRIGELTGGQAQFRYRQGAFFGDLTLGYKDLIYLHGSGRQETVSTLDPDNRSYFYPSVDASLVLSEAIPALKELSFFDYGKLRGGYSKVGQVNFPNSSSGVATTYGAYSLASAYNTGSGFPFGSTASLTLSNQVVQPGLRPEFTHSTEVGTELSFLRQRASLTATYYYQLSVDQIIAASIAPASGYSSYLLNAGRVQNNGVEVDLNFTPIESRSGFTWRVGANYNYNNNKVLKITDQTQQLALSTTGDNGQAQIYAIAGQPYPVIQGTDYNRDSQGRVILSYINLGQGTAANGTKYDRQGWVPSQASQLTNYGNSLPKHKYGFNTSVSFKGLTLAAQAEYRTGYYIYHGVASTMDFTGASARSASTGRLPFVMPNSSVLAADGVNYEANTTNLTPGGAEFWANSSYNRNIAANYVTKGDFFKLRELSLSYAVPTTLLGEAKFIKGLNLNLYGRNLFLWVPKENQWTDPEFSNQSGNAIGINDVGQTPPTRFYGASLSATF
ncbi:SusC/RagA family TonB-linked outer membrane protein [Hymenobacter crusticola]|uniref:TonB-dependent receptor plug domain-containing protein n=1 Tax=Hymenobacter crusticola TaxID=1770526 RepID=A0A243W7X6_9BACT|nr:SusC/RagA family TonB-linked outer membrane protein [Hymenobacter crusticola]OUJ71191.1 hypothetical protein BXP70_22165 [Hymenobacter crusticola]